MTVKVTETGKKAISNSIKDVEKLTDAEIVPVIVEHSSEYPHLIFSGSIITMFTSAFIYLLITKFPNTYILLTIEFFGFSIGYWIFNLFLELRIRMASDLTINKSVYKRALQAFYEHGLGNTDEKTGVLILVSIMEKKIQIITDQGIKDKISQDFLDSVIAEILLEIKDGQLTEGIIKGIRLLGSELAKIVPATREKNELSNNLIIE